MSTPETHSHQVTKIIVSSPHIYKPVGPYSQAILVEHTLYISGVLGLDTQAKLVSGGAETQTRQALDNLKHILEAGGSSLEAVIKTTILLGNIEDFKTVNEIYGQYFTRDYPARATFQVGKLPLGAAVEIEAIALSGNLTIAEAGPCPCNPDYRAQIMTETFKEKMNYVTLEANNMKYTTILLLILISKCHCDQISDTESYLSRFIADLWLEGTDVVRIIWRGCSKKVVDEKNTIDQKEYFSKFVRCMKRKTLRALDRSLNPDVVPIADGINFVRFEIVDHSGNPLPENISSFWTEKELEEGEWRHLALQRMAKIFRTHVIKFDFDEKANDKVEYRSRRRHHMLTMMMFGVVSIGMVFIPMGFQFLAVLGGKALLLAKMSLILASIQGLRKIATSPVGYGFYHSYPPFDHYDKRGLTDPSSDMKPPLPPFNLEDNIKSARMGTEPVINSDNHESELLKSDISKDLKESKDRGYPVYEDTLLSPTMLASVDDPPKPLGDLTTGPDDVQAHYALELPYNGFHFQNPTPVVPIRHI